MNHITRLVTVSLAVHTNVVEDVSKRMSFNEQTVTHSIHPEYDIITFKTFDYMEVIPTIQQYMPYIKVIMPGILDDELKNKVAN